jgi:site-specific recombinase
MAFLPSLRRLWTRKPREARQPQALSRASQELRIRTENFCTAASYRAQSVRVVELFAYIVSEPTERAFAAALVRWIRMLEHDRELRERFQATWASFLSRLDSVPLFASAGLPAQSALLPEATRRIFQRLLPSAREDFDAARFFPAIFSTPRAVERLLSIDAFLFGRLLRLLSPSAVLPRLHNDLREALRLLSTRTAGRGASPAIRERGSGQAVEQSPFYRLVFTTEDFVQAKDSELQSACFERWEESIRICREELVQVRLHMEDAGVSTSLMFDITSMESAFDRMELLAAALMESAQEALPAHALLNALVAGRLEDTRISALIRQNVNLLARKTVERTGHGGEHYIAHTPREYRQMWVAAIGGGLLTVFTAALKLRIIDGEFSPFIEGFFIGTNYAISFLLLQIFGLALATKQPSMTAATLAGIIRQNRGASRRSKIAAFSAAISRTQLAAALGNVIAVCAGAIAFERLWTRVFQAHYLAPEAAKHVYETLHPFTSATAFDAALTGVILWLAAVIGGWCENFAVYNRVPEAIAQHPLGARIGTRRMERIADWVENNIASWSTSIVLGYLLGFTPEIAHFFGLPLDVRHVTLSTGMFALAAARYGTAAFGHHWFYFAVAGIGLTFVLNLGVSFAIASILGLRAYDVKHAERLSILKYVLGQMARHPLRFLYPFEGGTPAEAEDAATAAHARGDESL